MKCGLALKLFEVPSLATQAHFKLDQLWLHLPSATFEDILDGNNFFPKATPEYFANFTIFIRNQVCLKELYLGSFVFTDELLETILKIGTLQVLDLKFPDFQVERNICARNASISTLYIEKLDFTILFYDDSCPGMQMGVYQIIKNCPSLRKLVLVSIDFTKMISTAVAEHLTMLEEIFVLEEDGSRIYDISSIRI